MFLGFFFGFFGVVQHLEESDALLDTSSYCWVLYFPIDCSSKIWWSETNGSIIYPSLQIADSMVRIHLAMVVLCDCLFQRDKRNFYMHNMTLQSTAPRSGDLRLVQNGNSSSSNTRGCLEVYYSGHWGTVCNVSWSSTNTRVACRQLGLPTSSTSWTTSSAGGWGVCTLQKIGLLWATSAVRCNLRDQLARNVNFALA